MVLAVNPYASARNPEQWIYDHLLACVKAEHPSQVLKRFHQLFILNRYPVADIRDALDAVISSQESIYDLLPFFNRCCYILINRWHINAVDRDRIGELTDLIKQVQTPGNSNRYTRSGKRLRQLVFAFVKSDYFSQL
ncbi:MAG: hypothetical protein HC810_08120, partial [Acaryochloridaceae cyanobacterium RL_2_7]|nr:hypothetical protein [Acaryochloridaceae cyanobacterium RL_2_7]